MRVSARFDVVNFPVRLMQPRVIIHEIPEHISFHRGCSNAIFSVCSKNRFCLCRCCSLAAEQNAEQNAAVVIKKTKSEKAVGKENLSSETINGMRNPIHEGGKSNPRLVLNRKVLAKF